MARKRSQLVCQHLENISRRMLEEYKDAIRDFVRGRNGVYALYRRGKLYYVGLASSLLGRLRMHLRDHHADTWDRFSVYLTIGTGFMKEIESLLLRIATPSGNKVRGEFLRSENLLPKVRAEYRLRRSEEEEELFGLLKRRKKPVARAKPYPHPTDGRKPILAEYAEQVRVLKARYKGKVVKAWVRRDGRIRFCGILYTSPSMSAAVACKKPSCDGWTFWKYERAPGDWVLLNALRK